MKENFCNACLKTPEDHEELYDFKSHIWTDTNDYLLIENLWYLVNPELGEVEDHKICESCLQQLKNSYDFKIQCIKSAEKMKLEEEEVETMYIYEENLIVEELEELEKSEPDILIKQEENVEDFVELQDSETPRFFFCSICGKGLTSHSLLYQHEKRHKKSEKRINLKYTCDLCNMQYRDKYSMKDHVLSHISEKLKCPVCSKLYKTKIALNTHLRNIHNSKVDAKCEVCEKSFKTNSALTKHRMIHNDTRNFPCEVCEKSFRLKHHLQQHLRMHTGLKTFKCWKCNMDFSHGGSLNAHLKAHIAKEQGIVFACPYENCQRSYSRKKILDSHMKSHILEPKFQCPSCTAKYHQKADFKTHMFSKHLNYLTFACEICNQKLKLNERFHKTYTTHVLACHKEIEEDRLTLLLEKIKKLKICEVCPELPEIFQDNPFRNNECPECFINFSTSIDLAEHRKKCIKN